MGCMENKPVEKSARTKCQWINAPFVFDVDADCSCCRRNKADEVLKHIDPGPGDVCLTCWLNKPDCSVDGCNEIAVESGLCREHFIDVEEPDGYNTVDRYGGMKYSGISLFRNIEGYAGIGKCRPKKAV